MKHTEILDVKTDLLLPYPRNARKHSPEQIDKIMTSITEFGFLTPCVIGSDNTIIAGHARVAAAKKLGLESVPCVLADHLTVAQQKAFCLIDNRLSETSEWDREFLAVELEDLINNAPNIDLPLMGFSCEEIAFMNLIPAESPDEPKKKNAPVKKIHVCPDCGFEFE